MPTNKNKRRCGARNVDGGRCANWALRESDPPRCKVHDPGVLRAGSKRRCTATTKAGRRCRNEAVGGGEVCGAHAGLNVPGETARRAGRACTARNKRGNPCRKWAVAGSDPPRCVVHGPQQVLPPAPPGARRCQALTREGKRCRGWAPGESPPGKALCNLHAKGPHRPPAQERCAATTASGEPCTQWAVRGSAGQYGARLCAAHLPDGDERKVRNRLPGPGERRCQAITVEGVRCPNWAMVADGGCEEGPDGPDGGGNDRAKDLCWMHAHPELNPSLTHGYYRVLPHFSPAFQAEIARMIEEGEPLKAAVALVRLKLYDAFAYFGDDGLSGDEKNRVARILFRGATTVGRLLMAQRKLAGLHWGPYSAGGTGKMLQSLTMYSEEE